MERKSITGLFIILLLVVGLAGCYMPPPNRQSIQYNKFAEKNSIIWALDGENDSYFFDKHNPNRKFDVVVFELHYYYVYKWVGNRRVKVLQEATQLVMNSENIKGTYVSSPINIYGYYRVYINGERVWENAMTTAPVRPSPARPPKYRRR